MAVGTLKTVTVRAKRKEADGRMVKYATAQTFGINMNNVIEFIPLSCGNKADDYCNTYIRMSGKNNDDFEYWVTETTTTIAAW
jgi:hypothetical protein